MQDSLSARMKLYEDFESQRRFMPLAPVVARLDGKNFSSWTRGLKRPYDERLSRIMIDVTRRLVKETGSLIGYTQSDEITLVFYSDELKSQIYFDGRILKICSILAATTTVMFKDALLGDDYGLDRPDDCPVFDCRVWQVPTLMEATNAVLQREQDATKNSIQMAARTLFSHREIDRKNGKEQQAMLLEKDVNWNDYPDFFKRGTYIQKRKVVRAFTAGELEDLPAKHAARSNPDLKIERTEVRRLEMPPFGKVTNRVGVIFLGESPVTDPGGIIYPKME